MDESPPRPAAVPADAVWATISGEWQLGPTDAAGRRQGVLRGWRADGSLRSETTYHDGKEQGVARLFHPDGTVARELPYEAGQLHGTVVAYGSESARAEPMQSCCVPDNAWRMQLDYERGSCLGQRWYDRQGVHILPSGRPFPPRPAAVPAEAHFDEQADRWITGAYNEKAELHGPWLRWSRAGVLMERDEYQAGRPDGRWQRFLPDGALLEQSDFRAGKRSGAYRRTNLPAGIYSNSRVVEERGAFDGDQAVGEWTLHDQAGETLRRFSLGAALTPEGLAASPALAALPPGGGDRRDAGAWIALADQLDAEGRLGDAVLAAARAAAGARSADDLRLRLAGMQLPFTQKASAELALQLMKQADGQLPLLVNGIVRGGDAGQLLRAVASARPGADEISLDLVDAALLLDPSLHEARVTRALLQLHRGHPLAARVDAESLPADWQEQRDFLQGYARVLFPVFDFWPARQRIPALSGDVPERPEQELEAVRAVIQKYATRLDAIRAAIAGVVGAEGGHARPWMLPELSFLLPDGPVALEQWEFDEIVVDDDAPEAAPGGESDGGGRAGADGPGAAAEPQPTRVQVDETLPPLGAALPSLLRLARREWNALCWLCWSVGLDRVALPNALAPPSDFGQAAAMTVHHLWRCRDKLATNGLRALSQGVAGFDWEGMSIDAMPVVLAEIATLEYLDQRALFFWLCDSGVQSPWQDNLRGD
ncbi:MAG TPA: hypothetical protein VMU50_07080 [Polyangia bacterium]|nr:hypothetical protein [Polyangia bacterium]